MATIPEVTPISDVKAAAKSAIDRLPDNATWDDVLYRIYFHKSIEAGLRDEAEGKLVDVEEIRKQFGLPE